jgi:glycosyltransferase involved in cell wall biosynthesis
MNDYIIITPAYNEERYIGQTIDSVLGQTILPKLWIIVDDGSTDNTSQIIRQKTDGYVWIHYVYRPKIAGQTYYASNVYAIEEGLRSADRLDYDYLAILDSDISLPQDYYEKIFHRFGQDEKLGIASGVYLVPGKNGFEKTLNDRRSCPKNIMVFRRRCFEDIGGFIPMKYGGEDTCACFMARMKNWKSWSFPDIIAFHNKPVGTGHAKGLLKIRFRQGIGEYFMATHPLFLLLKSLRRCIKEPPIIIGGLVRIAGFIYANFMGQKRQISDELIDYIRKEQFSRIFSNNRIPAASQVSNPE